MIAVDAIIPLLGRPYNPRDFGNGELEQLDDEFFLQDRKSGVAFTFDIEQRLVSTHIYGTNCDGFAPYAGELPYGLKFGMEIDLACQLLPKPNKEGGGGVSAIDGVLIPKWCRYDGPSFSIHLQFCEGLDLVTIMRSANVP